MSQAVIALGSNLGDREYHLQRALALLSETPGIHLLRTSRFYETAPVGMREGDPADLFLNAAILLETTLQPEALLEVCLQIERALGRERKPDDKKPGYQSRSLDLDILFFDDHVINQPGLIIPHPRLHERDFVLMPLNEIVPDWVHPVLQQSVSELVKARNIGPNTPDAPTFTDCKFSAQVADERCSSMR
jgi:2-amino-4-hydroxy-6-hydroxymethyldihydropteridine diphosphokinase